MIIPEEECKLTKKLCASCKNEKCYECKRNAKYNKLDFSCECDNGYTYCLETDECNKNIKDILIPLKSSKKCYIGKNLCKICLDNKCITCEKNANVNILTGLCECLKNHVYVNGECMSK